MTATLSEEKEISKNCTNEHLDAIIESEKQAEGQKMIEKKRDIPIDELITPEILQKLKMLDDESWEILYPSIRSMLEKCISKFTFFDIKKDPNTIETIIQETIVAFMLRLKEKENLIFDGKEKKVSAYLIKALRNNLINRWRKVTKQPRNFTDMTPTTNDGSETVNLADKFSSLSPSPYIETAQLEDSVFFLMCLQQALQRTRKALEKVSASRFMACKIDGKKPKDLAKEQGIDRHAIDGSNAKFRKKVFAEFSDIVRENGEKLSTKDLKKKFKISLCYLMDHDELHEATLTAGEKNKEKRKGKQVDRPIIARMDFIQQHIPSGLDLHYSGDCISLLQRSKGDWKYIRGYLLSNGKASIGRLDESTIELPTKNVSGCHALLTRNNGTSALEDKDSKNGTYVNDNQLAPNSPQELRTGDIIQIGDYRLIFIAAQ